MGGNIRVTLAALGGVSLALGAACSRAAPTAAPAAIAVDADTRADDPFADVPSTDPHDEVAWGAPRPSGPAVGAKAVLVDGKGLELGAFLVGSAPSAEHPKGTVVAPGWVHADDSTHAGRPTPGAGDLYVVEIDLATASVTRRLRVGAARPAVLARANRGLVLAVMEEADLSIVWLDGLESVRARYAVPVLAASNGLELHGLGAVADRLVAVLDHASNPGATAVVLDDEGHLVTAHACTGGLLHPSPPTSVDVWDDRVVLTDLVAEDGKPVCAFRLDAGARTEQARFPSGTDPFVSKGHLFAWADGDADAGRVVRRVDHNLRLAGVVPDPRPKVASAGNCTDPTGDPAGQSEVIEGLVVRRTRACCGGADPGAITICDPGPER
jgi:hypothetical protein